MTAGCQWIGPEQTEYPYTMCGCQSLTGKVYCGDHYWRVYKKGTAIAGRTAEKAVEKEIAELKAQQELEDAE
jgi:hypothetical protein